MPVTSRFQPAGVVVMAAVVLSLAAEPSAVHGYTPESPEVVAMINRALGYLNTATALTTATADLPGHVCLVGMAFFKTSGDLAHPKVQDALKRAHELAEQVRKQGVGENVYSETVACIFLCEADPQGHRSDIEALLGGLLQRQTPEGTWTYRGGPTVDTSQTQYGLLAVWSAHSIGIVASDAAVERALNWLLRTQSVDGSFTYRPADPGAKSPKRQAQGAVSLSMSVGGTGSLYLGAHLFGIGHRPGGAKTAEEKLPPALQRVSEPKKKEFVTLKPKTINIDALREGIALGDGWIDKNFKPENNPAQYTYYYLYGLERYQSFKELITGVSEGEPAWYNAGVDYLKKVQREDGSWNGASIGAGADTSFGILFLVRSMKKAIKKATIEEATLVGGMILPKDIENVRVVDGKVVRPQEVRDVDQLLKLLDRTDQADFDPTALPGGLSLDQDLTKRDSQLQRLRALVTNENWEPRLAAVKTLARARDLDNVPALIFALTDPDPRVVTAAKDGLRFLSRKFEGYGPPPNATDVQKREAQRQWKQWYLSIRPDGELLE